MVGSGRGLSCGTTPIREGGGGWYDPGKEVGGWLVGRVHDNEVWYGLVRGVWYDSDTGRVGTTLPGELCYDPVKETVVRLLQGSCGTTFPGELWYDPSRKLWYDSSRRVVVRPREVSCGTTLPGELW